MTFHPHDRAQNLTAADLIPGALYYVLAVSNGPHGTTWLHLLGCERLYLAGRFRRVRPVEGLYPDRRFFQDREDIP